jgi:hypothetical protein
MLLNHGVKASAAAAACGTAAGGAARCVFLQHHAFAHDVEDVFFSVIEYSFV